MAASKPPSPRLGKSQALNIVQGLANRLLNLVPSLPTSLSPVTIYQPGASGGVGNELIVNTIYPVTVTGTYGVWIAPDLNGDGSEYYVQVECFGAGGGGGGGNTTEGGGGGGGGEYACETQYPVIPGQAYAYIVGLPGNGGYNNSTQANPGSAGTNGGTTVFDLAGFGLAGGVVANGGQGGDQTSVGIGGVGGTGSSNSIHFPGGAGGSNNSANGSDYPLFLALANGMFVGNTQSSSIISAWYIMNDSNLHSATRNNTATGAADGTWTNFNGGFVTTGVNDAPTQTPAYTSAAGTYGPNQTQQGWASSFSVQAISKPSARFKTPSFPFSGNKVTFSCWVQAPSAATWGNTANGSVAVIATNSTNYTSNSLKGYALYAVQGGTPTNPSWRLIWAVGNGSSRQTVTYSTFTPTPGSWYYIVGTFNANLLTLYVNGASAGTATASFTSVPGGNFASVMGLNPSTQNDWFFGLVSNPWWANDCATSTLVSQAFGLTPATGGAGGGASGGPSAAGGIGSSGSGASGGAGGTGATQPANLLHTTTQAENGYNGAVAGGSAYPPSGGAGGAYGGGGGAAGNLGGSPAITVLTIPFTTAAAYAGTDAIQNPGAPYNVGQQTHPGSNVTSVLFAGGLPSDSASGSKNSLLMLPKGLSAMLGNNAWTMTNVFITFTNAFPANTVESVLQIGYSADTALPQNYTGASILGYIGAVPIPIGAGTITYDLSATSIGANMASGAATAFVIGPGSAPTFNAYNAQTGPEFYASIYGPGAYDTFGNAQYPYLTVVLQKSLSVQLGSPGSGGGILVTALNNANTPVAFAQPFASTDAAGNQSAQGFTGPTTAWQPGQAAGSFKPETWHDMTPILGSGWSVGDAISGGTYHAMYRILPTGDVQFSGRVSLTNNTNNTIATLPSGYFQGTSSNLTAPVCIIGANGSDIVNALPSTPGLVINSSGQLQLRGVTLNATASKMVVSLDGVIIPISAG